MQVRRVGKHKLLLPPASAPSQQQVNEYSSNYCLNEGPVAHQKIRHMSGILYSLAPRHGCTEQGKVRRRRKEERASCLSLFLSSLPAAGTFVGMARCCSAALLIPECAFSPRLFVVVKCHLWKRCQKGYLSERAVSKSHNANISLSRAIIRKK